MMWGDGWSGWGGWIVGALMMLVIWGGLVALIVYGLRGLGSDSARRREEPRAPRAKDILAQRFARGEISEEEYEERRRVLEHAA
jgi:putative membrane protein